MAEYTREELRRWAVVEDGTRFPAMVIRLLDEALELAKSAPSWPTPTKGREGSERMRVVEDAATAVILSATAMEASVTITAFLTHAWIGKLFDADTAAEFAGHFVDPGPKDGKIRKTRFNPEENVRLASSSKLDSLMRWLTRAIDAAPPWPGPAETKELRDERNRLVHRTVQPLPCNEEYVLARLSLLEDEDPFELLATASRMASIMFRCCHGTYRSFAKRVWSTETKGEPEQQKDAIDRIVAAMHNLGFAVRD